MATSNASEAPEFSRWHVSYRSGATDNILLCLCRNDAIDAACRLIDHGCDVYAIGTGPLTDSMSRVEIDRMYIVWGQR